MLFLTPLSNETSLPFAAGRQGGKSARELSAVGGQAKVAVQILRGPQGA